MTLKIDGRRKSKQGQLTDRQQEILKLLAEGYSNQEIARLLGVKKTTIDAHRNNLKIRLRLFDLSALVKYAIKHKIIPYPSI